MDTGSVLTRMMTLYAALTYQFRYRSAQESMHKRVCSAEYAQKACQTVAIRHGV